MSPLTLDQYEALGEDVGLDEVTWHEAGQIEGLTEAQDTIVETLDAIEQKVEHMVEVVGSWVAHLHTRLGQIEAKLETPFEGTEAYDFDLQDLRYLEAELDCVEQAREHAGTAVNHLALAMYFIGETPSQSRDTAADDEVDAAYWGAIKAESELRSWQGRLEDAIGEVLS